MDAILDKSGRLNSNVEVGKFTALTVNVGTYKDGVDVPGGANAGPLAGIAQESILPNGFNDYSSGVYQIVSGTAWPANAIPSSALGRGILYRRAGVSRAVAAGVVASGDEVNVADSQGRIKTVSEGAGTLVYILGQAMDASTMAGDVIRIFVEMLRRKA